MQTRAHIPFGFTKVASVTSFSAVCTPFMVLLKLANFVLGGQGWRKQEGKACLPRWGWEELSQAPFLWSQLTSHCPPPRCPRSHLEISGESLRSPLPAGRWPRGRRGRQGWGDPRRQVRGSVSKRTETGRWQEGALPGQLG